VVLYELCDEAVPVSQFVLPVGVTGFTVNGKTPTPVPAGASSVVVHFLRLSGEHTRTHKNMLGLQNSRVPHHHTPEERIIAGLHARLRGHPAGLTLAAPAPSHPPIGGSSSLRPDSIPSVKGHG